MKTLLRNNETFYSAQFHHTILKNKPEEVKKACDVLNTLTGLQVKAVMLFAESERETGVDQGFALGSPTDWKG